MHEVTIGNSQGPSHSPSDANSKNQLVAKLGAWRTIENVRCFDKSKQKQGRCAEDYQASIRPNSSKISRILLPTSQDYKPRYCFYSLQNDMLHGDVTKLTATSVVKSPTPTGINIGLVSFGFRLSPHASCFILLKSPPWAVCLSSFLGQPESPAKGYFVHTSAVL